MMFLTTHQRIVTFLTLSFLSTIQTDLKNLRTMETIQQWAFVAELECSLEKDWFAPHCYGALVHGRWVLTTARCVSEAPCKKVHLNLFANKEDVLTITSSFQQRHQDYKLINRTESITTIGKDSDLYPMNDIGLVRLDRYVVMKSCKIILSRNVLKPDQVCKTVRRKTTRPEPVSAFDPCKNIQKLYGDLSLEICSKIASRVIFDHPISFKYETISYGAPLVCSGILFGLFSEPVALGDLNISLSTYRLVWMQTGYYLDWAEKVLNKYGDSLGDTISDDVLKANEPTDEMDGDSNIFILTKSNALLQNGDVCLLVLMWLLTIKCL